MARKATENGGTTANIGFEQKLWLAADKLRSNMDAAETSGASKTAAGSPKGERGGANQYSRAERDRLPLAARRVGAEAPVNHVVLGLIFLKYISDTAGKCRMANAEIRTRSARPLRHSKFVIRHLPPPAEARWSHLQASAKQPTIGRTVDDAMVAIERDNPRLKGVLPKDYARPGLGTARRDSALSPREATPQSLSAAKDNQRSHRRRLPDRRAVVADFATAQIARRLNP